MSTQIETNLNDIENLEQTLLEDVSSHHLLCHTFTQPTYCSQCSGFIWGIRRQGLKCKDCSLAVHLRCRFNVKLPCVKSTIESGNLSESLNSLKTPTLHFRACEFNVIDYVLPTFCDHCGQLLFGAFHQGLQCITCKKNVHKNCMKYYSTQ